MQVVTESLSQEHALGPAPLQQQHFFTLLWGQTQHRSPLAAAHFQCCCLLPVLAELHHLCDRRVGDRDFQP